MAAVIGLIAGPADPAGESVTKLLGMPWLVIGRGLDSPVFAAAGAAKGCVGKTGVIGDLEMFMGRASCKVAVCSSSMRSSSSERLAVSIRIGSMDTFRFCVGFSTAKPEASFSGSWFSFSFSFSPRSSMAMVGVSGDLPDGLAGCCFAVENLDCGMPSRGLVDSVCEGMCSTAEFLSLPIVASVTTPATVGLRFGFTTADANFDIGNCTGAGSSSSCRLAT